eukprot:1269_1
MQTICHKKVAQCQDVANLIDAMKCYNNFDDKEHNLFEKCDIKEIYTNFAHSVRYHDTDAELDWIYRNLSSCNIKHCVIYSRNYRDRSSVAIKHNDISNKGVSYQTLDKIHCYYYHCYDLKYRLTENEKTYVNGTSSSVTNKHNLSTITSKLERLKNVVSKSSAAVRGQRFVSNLGLQCNNVTQDVTQDDSNKRYSYGVRFYYWDYFRDLDAPDYDHNEGYNFNDWYINYRYENIKEEVINNPDACLNMLQWNDVIRKAKLNLTHYKQLSADSDKEDYDKYHWNISHYGIKDGSPISLSHIISLMIYCNFDSFQYYFSKTCRRIDDETDLELKHRHSYYFYVAKLIREAVELFGTKVNDGTIRSFYHGIDDIMYFSQVSAFIYGVLSTSSSIEIAIQFSRNTGMVVELYPHSVVKYFDCVLLSEFGNEKELLFIGGRNCLEFQNIINVPESEEYREFVAALAILDKQRALQLYETDKSINRCLVKTDEASLLEETFKRLAKPIPTTLKKTVIALVNHEMSRYFPKQYKEWTELKQYIQCLLHFICINRKTVHMDLSQMNTEVADKYHKGYQGYKFLRSFFCHSDLDWINLKFVTTLYPKCDWIYVTDVPVANQQILDDIILFLQNNPNSKLKQIAFRLLGDSDDKKSIETMIHHNREQLKKMNFNMYKKVGQSGCVGINITRM